LYQTRISPPKKLEKSSEHDAICGDNSGQEAESLYDFETSPKIEPFQNVKAFAPMKYAHALSYSCHTTVVSREPYSEDATWKKRGPTD